RARLELPPGHRLAVARGTLHRSVGRQSRLDRGSQANGARTISGTLEAGSRSGRHRSRAGGHRPRYATLTRWLFLSGLVVGGAAAYRDRRARGSSRSRKPTAADGVAQSMASQRNARRSVRALLVFLVCGCASTTPRNAAPRPAE